MRLTKRKRTLLQQRDVSHNFNLKKVDKFNNFEVDMRLTLYYFPTARDEVIRFSQCLDSIEKYLYPKLRELGLMKFLESYYFKNANDLAKMILKITYEYGD